MQIFMLIQVGYVHVHACVYGIAQLHHNWNPLPKGVQAQQLLEASGHLGAPCQVQNGQHDSPQLPLWEGLVPGRAQHQPAQGVESPAPDELSW